MRGRRLNSNRLSVALIAIGTALMCAGFLLILATLTDIPVLSGWVNKGTRGYSDLKTVATFGEPIKTPTPGPTPTPTNKFPPGTDAPVSRLIIPRFEIDANVVKLGVDEGGVMQSPSNAYDTGWYQFTAKPGFGSNAVFGGHVDYVHVGPAVFWHLKDLEPGDTIEVKMDDGTLYTYSVNTKIAYDADTAPVDLIVGATPEEQITLITCTGTFSSASHQYDKRLVVTAVRVS